MKLKINNRYKEILIMSFLFVGLFFACNDDWNEHYDKKNKPDGIDLLSAMKQDPDLSVFVKMIEISGYTQRVAGTEAYTIWAPTNEALNREGISIENLSSEDSVNIQTITKSHIARYFYSTSEIASSEKRILMLTDKYVYFNKGDNNYLFNEKPIITPNTICSNGVLHKLDGIVTPLDNLWEYISKSPELKSVYDFIIKYDSTYLDLTRSKPIGINDEGYTVYDSVMIFENKLLNYLGDLNLEDSVYTVIAPTETAYQKAFDVYKEYYKSYGWVAAERKVNPEVAAATTKQRTDSMIVNNLVFRGSYADLLKKDSVRSTTRTVFKENWKDMFNGTFHKASNGDIMFTDDFKQNIYESVHKPLYIDFIRYGNIGYEGSISWSLPEEETSIEEAKGGFLLLEETTNAPSPILSVYWGYEGVSAKYDIYCTIIPGVASDPLNINERTKLDFGLQYRLGNSNRSFELLKGFITDPLEVQRVLVAQNVEIPYFDVSARLTIAIKVSQTESELYRKRVRIKDVTFVPVRTVN